jgi:hypothetical protein
MRSKQEYALQTNDKGRQVPVKLGMAPIQRDQIDYEFTLVFDVNLGHSAIVSKDRTGLFNDGGVNLADPKTAELIRGWLDKGVEAPAAAPEPPKVTEPPQTQQSSVADPQQYPYAILKGTTLTCTPLTIKPQKRKVKATEENPDGEQIYLFVMFKGNVNGVGGKPVSEFSVFDTKLFEAIGNGLHKECQFKVTVKEDKAKGKTYINCEDVLYVGDQMYEFGKPYVPGEENSDAESVEPEGRNQQA